MKSHQLDLLKFLLIIYRSGAEPLIADHEPTMSSMLMQLLVEPDLAPVEKIEALETIPPSIVDDFKAAGLTLTVTREAEYIALTIDNGGVESVTTRYPTNVPYL